MVGLCDDNFDEDKLFTILKETHSTLTDMASFAFDDTTEVIEQLARAKKLFQQMDELKNIIVGSALSGILCSVIKKFDLEFQLSLIEGRVNDLTAIVADLDESISAIDADNIDSFEELESLVSGVFVTFDDKKDKIFDYVKNKTKEVFSVLVSIGADQQYVNEAIEDAELNGDIKQYLLDVFDDVLTRVLNDL